MAPAHCETVPTHSHFSIGSFEMRTNIMKEECSLQLRNFCKIFLCYLLLRFCTTHFYSPYIPASCSQCNFFSYLPQISTFWNYRLPFHGSFNLHWKLKNTISVIKKLKKHRGSSNSVDWNCVVLNKVRFAIHTTSLSKFFDVVQFLKVKQDIFLAKSIIWFWLVYIMNH